jgi:ferrous iron transport protein A
MEMCISVELCKCELVAFTSKPLNPILVHHMSAPASSLLALSDLREGDSATVVSIGDVSALGADPEGRESLIARLRDIGFVTGARCEVVARMWLGDPLAVRVGGSTFALRRVEAAAVRVERGTETRAAA